MKRDSTSQTRRQDRQPTPKLSRTTFSTDRSHDFFAVKELTTQVGHPVAEWPLVILKELCDNALDACETAGVAPVIVVATDATGIAVADNGPGLPEATLAGALNFNVRCSDKECYLSPCRGAQGNALMTLLPMPWVVDAEHGHAVVTAGGQRHTIRCRVGLGQRVLVDHDVTEVAKGKNSRPRRAGNNQGLSGTTVRLQWQEKRDPDGDVVWPFGDLRPQAVHRDGASFAERFHRLIEAYSLFNPHLTLTLDWFGETSTWKPTDKAWTKWLPTWPTSAHWYEQRHLARLIEAYVAHDRDRQADRLVSQFVSEFNGLTGSRKRTRVLDAAGLKRAKLSDLVAGDRLDHGRVGKLLSAMQANSTPVKAKALGVIGETHFKARLLALGVVPESFRYSRKLARDGLPWMLETAFGWRGQDSRDRRLIYSGANWSGAITNPFRSFGSTGEGLETLLSDQWATADEPVVLAVHLAQPRVEYLDRGKSSLVVGGGDDDA
jgi:hypothetical protein